MDRADTALGEPGLKGTQTGAGRWALVAGAATYLERAGDGPEVLSDKAVVALARGDTAGALTLLDKALQARTGFTPALWNRGLALRELELWAQSAEAFEKVAAQGEPGWADEARAQAQGMRERLRAEQQGIKDAWGAGAALVEGKGAVSTEQMKARPDLYRLFLYDALRAAQTPEQVKALWPLAKTLDAHFGGGALRDAVRWTEARTSGGGRRWRRSTCTCSAESRCPGGCRDGREHADAARAVARALAAGDAG